MPEDIATITVTLDDIGRAEIDEIYGEQIESLTAKITNLKGRKRRDARLIERLREMVLEEEANTKTVLESNTKLREQLDAAKRLQVKAAEQAGRMADIANLQADGNTEILRELDKVREALAAEKDRSALMKAGFDQAIALAKMHGRDVHTERAKYAEVAKANAGLADALDDQTERLADAIEERDALKETRTEIAKAHLSWRNEALKAQEIISKAEAGEHNFPFEAFDNGSNSTIKVWLEDGNVHFLQTREPRPSRY